MLRYLGFFTVLLTAGKLPSVAYAHSLGLAVAAAVALVLVTSYVQHRTERRLFGWLKAKFRRFGHWLNRRFALVRWMVASAVGRWIAERKRKAENRVIASARWKQYAAALLPPLAPAGNGLAASVLVTEQCNLHRHWTAAGAAVTNTLPVAVTVLLLGTLT